MNSTNGDEELFLEFEEVADLLGQEQTLTTYSISYLNAQREVALQVQGLQQRLNYLLCFYERQANRDWQYPAQIKYENGWTIDITKVRTLFVPIVNHNTISITPDPIKLLVGGELYFLRNNRLTFSECTEIVAILKSLQFDELRAVLLAAIEQS
ncbi:MAG: hypothetical protein JST84_04705 [Acidobacteria bacterium]|nr:hypothetical protein [Acidobacteriota bacterium]